MTTPLHQRGDLLDLIQRAIDNGTDQERKDLLAAALQRIKDMNGEHDTMATERGTSGEAKEELLDVISGFAKAAHGDLRARANKYLEKHGRPTVPLSE